MDTIIIDFSKTITEEDLKIDPLAKHCVGVGTIIRIEEGWQEALLKGVRRMLAEYETGDYQWNQWKGWITNDTGDTLAHICEPLPTTEHDIISWVGEFSQPNETQPRRYI